MERKTINGKKRICITHLKKKVIQKVKQDISIFTRNIEYAKPVNRIFDLNLQLKIDWISGIMRKLTILSFVKQWIYCKNSTLLSPLNPLVWHFQQIIATAPAKLHKSHILERLIGFYFHSCIRKLQYTAA